MTYSGPPVVMGLDVAYAHVGLVMVTFDGNVVYQQCISTEKDSTVKRVADDTVRRCSYIAMELQNAISIFGPIGAFAELPTGASQSASSAYAMGLGTGVIVSVLGLNVIPTEYVTPIAVKKATHGTNKATKQEVQAAVAKLFKWNEWTKKAGDREHICDAAGAVRAGMKGKLWQELWGQWDVA